MIKVSSWSKTFKSMVGTCVASKKVGGKNHHHQFSICAKQMGPHKSPRFMDWGSSRPKPQNFGWIHDFHDTSGSTWSPDPSGHLPPHHLWARLHPGQPGWRGTAGCRRSGGAIGEVAHVVLGDRGQRLPPGLERTPGYLQSPHFDWEKDADFWSPWWTKEKW